MPLYGRDTTAKLVAACVRSRSAPLLVFTGTRYSGKTAVIDTIRSQLETAAPYALLDLAHRHVPSLITMLDELVPQLRQGPAEYGRLRFTRYIIARLVMTQNYPIANLTERDAATSAIAALLVREWRPEELRAIFTPAVDAMAARYDVPPEMTKVAAGIVFDAVTRRFPGRKWVLRKPGVGWYQQQDPQHRKPEYVLTDLYVASRGEAGDDSATLTDRLLMSAFLEDLRSDLKHGSWMNNATILVDNADGPAWRAFQEHFLARRAADDAIAVVAASRGHQETAEYTSVGKELAELREVTSLSVGATTGLPADCRVRVPDLSVKDVRTMVRTEKLPNPNDALTASELAETLHELTGGHAGATRVLLDAVSAPADRVDLRVLLGREIPENPRPVVRDHLCDLLARNHETGAERADPDEAEQIIDDLATCSAARDLLWARKLITAGRLTDGRRFVRLATDDDIYRRELWTRGAVPSRPVLLPVLRRLLLLRLAAREADSPYGWDAVHGVLRDLAARAEEQDTDGELYHALALGEVGHVAERMWTLFDAGDTTTWLSRMGAVLVAPNRLDLSGSLVLLAGALRSGAAPACDGADHMAGVIAAQWLMSDPLTSGRRRLLRNGAQTAYTELRDQAPVRLQEVLPGTWQEAWRQARHANATGAAGEGGVEIDRSRDH